MQWQDSFWGSRSHSGVLLTYALVNSRHDLSFCNKYGLVFSLLVIVGLTNDCDFGVSFKG